MKAKPAATDARQPNPPCPACNSTDTVKCGFRRRVSNQAQMYRCRCGFRLVPGERRPVLDARLAGRVKGMVDSGLSVRKVAAALLSEGTTISIYTIHKLTRGPEKPVAAAPAPSRAPTDCTPGNGKALPKPHSREKNPQYHRCACGNRAAGYRPCDTCVIHEARHGAARRPCISCRNPRGGGSFCGHCLKVNRSDTLHGYYVRAGRGLYGPVPRGPRKTLGAMGGPKRGGPRKKERPKSPRRKPNKTKPTPNTKRKDKPAKPPKVRPPHDCDNQEWCGRHGFTHGRAPGSYVPFCWQCNGWFDTNSQLDRRCPCCGENV